jgi:alpha-N-acetylglucosaminidase
MRFTPVQTLIAVFVVGLFYSLPCAAQELSGEKAAQALIARVLPGHAASFVCNAIPAEGGKDVFEIEGQEGKIVLRGNNGVSLTMAFNWYLRYQALINFDWQAAGPLKFDGALPLPKEKTHQVCVAKERFILNYCTYGYSFPWWGWDQWQRFVDWMAMNGINRPLMQAGQEATWLQVWKSYGLTEEQVRAYFTGPAVLPWHRMANIDKFLGPLPMSYIDGQMKLQKQILARARALGMKPILGAFAGHIPEAIKTVKPEAKIVRIDPWMGDTQWCTWFLDPNDPLFKNVQQRFLKEQTKMYGTDHLYAADPFNEMKAPSYEPDYLAGVARTIYGGMAAADPAAVWYQMSWTFNYDKNWTKPRLKAMTEAVPKGKLVYLDYTGGTYAQWDGFFGAPFVNCVLMNFGGDSSYVFNLNGAGMVNNEANCIGIGSTLEGLGNYPAVYDFLFEQPWHAQDKINMETWIAAYATRRAGRPDPAVLDAYKNLGNNDHGYSQFFITTPFGLHDYMRESLTPRHTPCEDALVVALDKMLQADPACRKNDGYRFDVVNLTRVCLDTAASRVSVKMWQAVAAGDLAAYPRDSKRLLEIGRDMDTLLATRHEWLLGRWIAEARAWGATPEEKDCYETCAREILSTWFAGYVKREWNGLLGAYHLPRWEKFLKSIEQSGVVKPLPDCKLDKLAWSPELFPPRYAGVTWDDEAWVKSKTEKFATVPQGDCYETARKLFEKYHAELATQSVPTDPNAKPLTAPRNFNGARRLVYNASKEMSKPGSYTVSFKRTAGDWLRVDGVAALQDGKEIAADQHRGDVNSDAAVPLTLKIEKLEAGKPVNLVMDVCAEASTNTTGVIEIKAAR